MGSEQTGNKLHYHIRWCSRERLDWEPFPTHTEAEVRAEELRMPGEQYSVEALDGSCPFCKPLRFGTN
jgi:hypothetical protein